MEDGTWTKVVNHRNQKRKNKHKELGEEKAKWDQIKKEIPHVVLPVRAKKLQQKLNIDRLEEKLLSEEFIEYQKSGWKYVKILKSSDNKPIDKDDIPSDTTISSGELLTYSILDLENGWGDFALFSMAKKKPQEE